MKRFILSLTAAAVLSMPMAASALEKMDNKQLKSSTGQAGVSIAVDDIVIYKTAVADVTYWDTDGFQDEDTAYGIKMNYADGFKQLTTIDAITDVSQATDGSNIYSSAAIADEFDDIDSGIGIIDDTASIRNGDGFVSGMETGISPLSIDVGACDTLSDGYLANGGTDGIAGVVIGLPTVEISTYSAADFKTVQLTAGAYDDSTGMVASDPANAHDYITIEKSGTSTMAILGGQLEIAPH